MITYLTRDDAIGILQARLDRLGVSFPASAADSYIVSLLDRAVATPGTEVHSLHAQATVEANPESGTYTIRTATEEV